MAAATNPGPTGRGCRPGYAYTVTSAGGAPWTMPAAPVPAGPAEAAKPLGSVSSMRTRAALPAAIVTGLPAAWPTSRVSPARVARAHTQYRPGGRVREKAPSSVEPASPAGGTVGSLSGRR
ncbi:MAG: hypothetical protein ACYDA8_09630 [Deferrisomatales bacterium]